MTLVKVNNPGFSKTFSGAFDSLFTDLERTFNQVNGTKNSFHFPPANVVETNEAFVLELLVPGRKKENFSLKVEDNILTVAYQEDEKLQESNATKIRTEFKLGAFTRNFTLDDSVNTDNIEAKYTDGLLKVVLPKRAEAKPATRQISIL